ncbi:NAD-dependent epimerase/dehydratase family protein [Asticcacaulis benevestitus]|uniref:Epimerase n=1 Tax=Asticcacaulis benevestitus DSM 16100 = ATCC BAA-896 TaxID=1121022 RepID=V4PS42_9CAUL|nr:NAD-dependent epimerase/dehydratase family protein [Asticcacaulis benevestitus]ESQ91111.1 epimerase [Asticcacaulis benevestitus DSM 16100 = ATCC BAA-896]
MPRILITGAAGFLGFHLARLLAGDVKNHIIAVDNFVRGEHDEALRNLVSQPNVDLIEADLSDPVQVAKLPTDVDYVYHLAAMNGTQNFYERPMDVIKYCTLPTLYLAEHYGRGSKLQRFVYAGTSESYASTVTRFNWPVPTAEDVPLCVDDVTNPRWSYAMGKMHGEVVVAQAGRSFEMPYSIIRYHNAYGPRMGDRHVVPDFYIRAKEGVFELFGHEDTRAFLYVDDAVRGTRLIAETPACEGQIVNLGGGREITMLDLAKEMMAARGMEGEIKLHPSPVGSVKRRLPDLTRLKALTGFEETISLSEGLKLTAAFYLDGTLVDFQTSRDAS